MAFRVAARGTMNTLVERESGAPVATSLRRVVVIQPPHDSNGKTYMTVKVDPDDAGTRIVRDADAFIRRAVGDLDYDPILGDCLVVKIPKRCLIDDGIVARDTVDIDVTLGNFASFGYCWLASMVAKTKLRVDGGL